MRTNPAVMKKLNFRSGNKSVSRIPLVSIIGFTALNKIAEVARRSPITISFRIHDINEPDDTAIGLTKKIITRRRVTPKITQEYLVFSLYCTM
jgi:hypothetical protein